MLILALNYAFILYTEATVTVPEEEKLHLLRGTELLIYLLTENCFVLQLSFSF